MVVSARWHDGCVNTVSVEISQLPIDLYTYEVRVQPSGDWFGGSLEAATMEEALLVVAQIIGTQEEAEGR